MNSVPLLMNGILIKCLMCLSDGISKAKLIDQWMECIDKGDVVGTLFVDFRQTFDLVDHSILIETNFIYINSVAPPLNGLDHTYPVVSKQCLL